MPAPSRLAILARARRQPTGRGRDGRKERAGDSPSLLFYYVLSSFCPRFRADCRLCVAGGQGALRRVWPHAPGRQPQGQRPRQEARPAPGTSACIRLARPVVGRASPPAPSNPRHRPTKKLGTLGAGNHYAEVQVVDEIFDQRAANKMGVDRVGQVGLCLHELRKGERGKPDALGPVA